MPFVLEFDVLTADKCVEPVRPARNLLRQRTPPLQQTSLSSACSCPRHTDRAHKTDFVLLSAW